MSEYTAYENQSLLDVSAHVYGTSIYAVQLALLNKISLSDNLKANQLINLIDLPKNNLVIKSLESRNIIPATSQKIKNAEPIEFAYEFAIQF